MERHPEARCQITLLTSGRGGAEAKPERSPCHLQPSLEVTVMLSTIRDTESEHVPRCGAETAEGVAERSEKNMGPGKMGEGPWQVSLSLRRRQGRSSLTTYSGRCLTQRSVCAIIGLEVLMVFFFCREENPLVTNEPHVAACGEVAVHGEPPFRRMLLHPAYFVLSLGLTRRPRTAACGVKLRRGYRRNRRRRRSFHQARRQCLYQVFRVQA